MVPPARSHHCTPALPPSCQGASPVHAGHRQQQVIGSGAACAGVQDDDSKHIRRARAGHARAGGGGGGAGRDRRPARAYGVIGLAHTIPLPPITRLGSRGSSSAAPALPRCGRYISGLLRGPTGRGGRHNHFTTAGGWPKAAVVGRSRRDAPSSNVILSATLRILRARQHHVNKSRWTTAAAQPRVTGGGGPPTPRYPPSLTGDGQRLIAAVRCRHGATFELVCSAAHPLSHSAVAFQTYASRRLLSLTFISMHMRRREDDLLQPRPAGSVCSNDWCTFAPSFCPACLGMALASLQER